MTTAFILPWPNGLLRTFAPSVITPDVCFHLNLFAIHDFDIFRDTIELVSITIFCHNFSTCPLAGVLYIAVKINGGTKVQVFVDKKKRIIETLIGSIQLYLFTVMQNRKILAIVSRIHNDIDNYLQQMSHGLF